MQTKFSNAFFLSATLHGLVAALILLMTYVWHEQAKEAPKIFELVAGEGDNYMATAAPALGVENGIKVPLIEAPVARPAPVEPEPVAVERVPEPVVERAPVVTPAPKAAPVKAPPDAIRDFSKDVKRIEKKRADRLIAKNRAAQEAAEKKARAEEAKKTKMTKEEFDRLNKGGSAAPKGAAPSKITKINAEGIAKGVIGGSTANKIGGAGGKALSRDEADALDAYFSMLKRRLKEALDKPPGLSDTLVAIVEVRISSNGLLSGARISRSSGSDEFDQAALAAIARVRSIGPRPDGKSEVLSIPFRMREEDDG